MKNIVFTDAQGEKISKITGRIMTDKLYEQTLISNYFNYPSLLSIFEIYTLEYILKRHNELEFNLGYFNILEQYAGDYLNYSTYQEYNDFIKNWNSDLMFKNAMRKRFEENDIGSLPSAALAAYRIIKQTENNMNRNNKGR